MKKTVTALVVLAGIAAAVAYKLKKDEKDLLDQKLEMLSSSDPLHEETSQPEEKEVEETHENEMNDEVKKQLELQSDEVIDKLKNEDDQVDEERPIQHFIDFKNQEDLEGFKAKVIEKGYVVTQGENDLQLSVLHIAPIKRAELLANVYYLANQAYKYHGTYQGWQSRKVL